MLRIGSTLTLCAVTAIHLAIRLRPAAQVFGSSETEPLLAGADSFCHAHRIRLLFAQSPGLVFHDRFMFHPVGTIVEWPLGFDWTIASALRLFTSSWDVAVWWLPWAAPLVSLAALFSFIALTRSALTPRLALLLSGCFALNLAFIRVSTLAELDHHVVETLGLVLLLWIPLLADHWSRGQSVAMGLALAWLIWNTTLLAFVVFGFFALWLLTLPLHKAPKARLSHFGLALLLPLSAVSLVEAHARSAYFAFHTLSLLHPLLIAVALGMMALSATIPIRFVWAAAAVSGVITLAVAPDALSWIANFVTARDALVGNINESRPLFSSPEGFTWTYAHGFFGPAYALFPFAWWALYRDARREEPPFNGFGLPLPTLFLSLGLFALSLTQKRFAHMFVPALVLIVGVWATRLRRRGPMLVLITLLLVEPSLVFFPETAHAIPDSAQNAMRIGHILRDAANGRDDLGVSAPPNLGSGINYFARLPAVTSAFFYPRYLQTDLKLRSIEASSDLVTYLRQQRLGFLIAVDDARYRTMLLRTLGPPSLANQAAVWEQSPCQGALLRYAFDRIACGADTPRGLTLLTQEQRSTDARRLWRRLKLFRIDP